MYGSNEVRCKYHIGIDVYFNCGRRILHMGGAYISLGSVLYMSHFGYIQSKVYFTSSSIWQNNTLTKYSKSVF